MSMWDMKYRSRGEYIEALEHQLTENGALDTEAMVEDFKRYFFKKNRQSIGDTDIIMGLPTPEELGTQYAGKHYAKRRACKKDGSAGFFKRFGVFLLSVIVYLLLLAFYLIFAAMLLGGLVLIAIAGVVKFELLSQLPAQVSNLIENLPYQSMLESNTGLIFYAAVGVFLLMLAGTILKALRRIFKKYRTWTLKAISGRFRLPISMDDVYSKPWRVLVYILLPISMIVALVCGGMMFLGVNFVI